jgi:hypothetical protein
MIRRFWYTLRSVTALILRTIGRLLIESGERKKARRRISSLEDLS